jgi:phage-related tail fiber protein
MPTNTTNFNLVKPGQDDFYDVSVPNANMDTIDGVLKTLQDAINSGATEQELAKIREELAAHLADKASLTKAGHVQLNNATNSTDESTAATPKSVKAAMDRAVTAEQNAKDYVDNANLDKEYYLMVQMIP